MKGSKKNGMFLYFGCVFLEILKAQLSKANYQDQESKNVLRLCLQLRWLSEYLRHKSSLFSSVRHFLASVPSLNHRFWVTESRLEKPKSAAGADDCL